MKQGWGSEGDTLGQSMDGNHWGCTSGPAVVLAVPDSQSLPVLPLTTHAAAPSARAWTLRSEGHQPMPTSSWKSHVPWTGGVLCQPAHVWLLNATQG